VATTLGVAVASRHIALALVVQRRTGPVALDQVLLEPNAGPTTSPAETPQQVLAEVQRISAVLGTHKRPLSKIAVAAVEAVAASTAIDVVEALNQAGLESATLVPPPSSESLAKGQSGNSVLERGGADSGSTEAALTAAHEIALEALELIPDVSGRASGNRQSRRVLAVAATAVATVGVGLIGFRLLSDQTAPADSPVQATNPVPTQATAPELTPPPAPTSVVSANTNPPVVIDTSTPAPTTAEVSARATASPTPTQSQDPAPTSVETPPPGEPGPQGQEPPPSPAPPSPAPSTTEPPAPPSQAVEPQAPTDQRPPETVPPTPAAPQAGPAPQ
jgi:hypothetical protein